MKDKAEEFYESAKDKVHHIAPHTSPHDIYEKAKDTVSGAASTALGFVKESFVGPSDDDSIDQRMKEYGYDKEEALRRRRED